MENGGWPDPMKEDYNNPSFNCYKQGIGQDLQHREQAVNGKAKTDGDRVQLDGPKPVDLYVKCIPLDMDEEMLKNLFSLTCTVKEVHVARANPSYSHKIGFVTVATARDAQNAIEKLDGFVVRDKTLQVAVKLPKKELQRRQQKKERETALLQKYTGLTAGNDSQEMQNGNGHLSGNGEQNMQCKRSAGAATLPQPETKSAADRKMGDRDQLPTSDRKGEKVTSAVRPAVESPAVPRVQGNSVRSQRSSMTSRGNSFADVCANCGGLGVNRCGGCKSVHYCSQECQVTHWPQHKRVCAYNTSVQPAVANPVPVPDFDDLVVDLGADMVQVNRKYLESLVHGQTDIGSDSSSSADSDCSPFKVKLHRPGKKAQKKKKKEGGNSNVSTGLTVSSSKREQAAVNERQPVGPSGDFTKGSLKKAQAGGPQAGNTQSPALTPRTRQGAHSSSFPGASPKVEGERVKDGTSSKVEGEHVRGGASSSVKGERVKAGAGSKPAAEGEQEMSVKDKNRQKPAAAPWSDKGGPPAHRGPGAHNVQFNRKHESGGSLLQPSPGLLGMAPGLPMMSYYPCVPMIPQPDWPAQPNLDRIAQRGSTLDWQTKAGNQNRRDNSVPQKGDRGNNRQKSPVSSQDGDIVKSQQKSAGSKATSTASRPSRHNTLQTQLHVDVSPAVSSVDGDTMSVLISHMDSPQSFWVQETRRVIELVGKIAETVQSRVPVVGTVTTARKGDLFLCQFESVLCRARVEAVRGQAVTVFYLDYGNCEDTRLECLLPLPDDVARLPALAIHCSLPVEPCGGGRQWPAETTSTLRSLFPESKLATLTPLDKVGDLMVVRLVGQDDGVDAADFLIKNKMAVTQTRKMSPSKSSSPQQQRAVHSPAVSKSLAKADAGRIEVSSMKRLEDSLEVGQCLEVRLMDSEGPNDLFLHISHLQPAFDHFVDSMIQYYNCHPPTNFLPEQGELVAGRFSGDGRWYRAEVVEMVPDRQGAVVYYVDFGNRESLPLAELRPMQPDFASLPVQGLRCRVSGVMKAVDKWPPALLTPYRELLSKFLTPVGDTLHGTAIVKSVSHQVVEIDLVHKEMKLGLAELLLSLLKGRALPQTSLAPRPLTSPSVSKSAHSASPVDRPKPSPALCSSVSPLAAAATQHEPSFSPGQTLSMASRRFDLEPPVPRLEPSVPVLEPSMPQLEPSIPPLESSVPPLEPSIPPLESSVPPLEPSIPPLESSIPPLEPSLSAAASPKTSSLSAASPKTSSLSAASHKTSSLSAASPKTSSLSAASHKTSSLSAASHKTSSLSAASLKTSAPALDAANAELVCESLTVGDQLFCNIQEIISSQEFYVNKFNNQEMLNQLRKQLNEFCTGPDGQPPRGLHLGSLVLAQFSLDKEWYRGRIESISADRSSCLVFFVDYGNREEKSVGSLRAVPSGCLSLAAQAIQCKLAGVPSSVAAENEAKFRTLCQTSMELNVVERHGHVWVVDLFTSDKKDVALLLGLKHAGCMLVDGPAVSAAITYCAALASPSSRAALASPSSHAALASPSSHAALASPSSPGQPAAASGGAVLRSDVPHVEPQEEALKCMVVVHVDSPAQFFCIDINSFRQQMTILAELDAISKTCCALDTPPCAGQLLCGLFSDGWYRCEVLEVDGQRARVVFCDYGNMAVLDLADLRPLSKEFCCQFPIATVKCSLHDIQPASGSEWDEESVCLAKGLLSDKIVSLTVKAKVGGIWQVAVTLDTGDDVASVLVQDKRAVRTDAQREKEALMRQLQELQAKLAAMN